MPTLKADLILLAAGSGSRMDGVVPDKILAPLLEVPVFLRSWRAFRESGCVDRIIVVYRDAVQAEALASILAGETSAKAPIFVQGGATRADSVRRGLAASGAGAELVAIHDAARPFIAPNVIRESVETAARDGAAVVARPVVDTIKRVPRGTPPVKARLEDLDRATLWAMETPQVFRRDWLEAGYGLDGLPLTDDTAAVAALGHGVTIVSNPWPNPKITRPEDLAWAEFLLKSAQS